MTESFICLEFGSEPSAYAFGSLGQVVGGRAQSRAGPAVRIRQHYYWTFVGHLSQPVTIAAIMSALQCVAALLYSLWGLLLSLLAAPLQRFLKKQPVKTVNAPRRRIQLSPLQINPSKGDSKHIYSPIPLSPTESHDQQSERPPRHSGSDSEATLVDDHSLSDGFSELSEEHSSSKPDTENGALLPPLPNKSKRSRVSRSGHKCPSLGIKKMLTKKKHNDVPEPRKPLQRTVSRRNRTPWPSYAHSDDE